MLFDTHAHLNDGKYEGERDETIKRAKETGVGLIVNVGCNPEAAERTIELTRKYSFIYGAVGMHPHDAKDFEEGFCEKIKKWVKEEKIVALGEMGLDYHYDYSPRDVQKKIFRRQIALARELKLPIIIHDREAHQDVLDIVREEKAGEVGGVFHCYSGSWPMAKEIMEMGFFIALGGTVTFQNAVKPLDVAKRIPLEHLLLETDCPYLAPVPFRGKRNEPAYVAKVAERIAEIKGVSVDEIVAQTTANGKKLFGIKE